MPALITWWTQDVVHLAPHSFEDAVVAAGSDLLARWNEPQRRYHRTTHLVEMFWALEELEDAGEIDVDSAALARVAAWFHDAVYDPGAGAGANEADSGLLAGTVLRELELDDDQIATVVRLVLMTVDHADGECDDGPIDRAFHDADLWILSADDERFDDYCSDVRAEYAAVPGAAYRAARAQILRGFGAREQLYRTDYARSQWEPRARANLDRELDRLAAPDIDGA
ncbi:MAG: hypothetical protein WAR57_00015 [Candidatus Phosphoribacter sp.]